jgi:hypothetical protein
MRNHKYQTKLDRKEEKLVRKYEKKCERAVKAEDYDPDGYFIGTMFSSILVMAIIPLMQAGTILGTISAILLMCIPTYTIFGGIFFGIRAAMRKGWASTLRNRSDLREVYLEEIKESCVKKRQIPSHHFDVINKPTERNSGWGY